MSSVLPKPSRIHTCTIHKSVTRCKEEKNLMVKEAHHSIQKTTTSAYKCTPSSQNRPKRKLSFNIVYLTESLSLSLTHTYSHCISLNTHTHTHAHSLSYTFFYTHTPSLSLSHTLTHTLSLPPPLSHIPPVCVTGLDAASWLSLLLPCTQNVQKVHSTGSCVGAAGMAAGCSSRRHVIVCSQPVWFLVMRNSAAVSTSCTLVQWKCEKCWSQMYVFGHLAHIFCWGRNVSQVRLCACTQPFEAKPNTARFSLTPLPTSPWPKAELDASYTSAPATRTLSFSTQWTVEEQSTGHHSGQALTPAGRTAWPALWGMKPDRCNGLGYVRVSSTNSLDREPELTIWLASSSSLQQKVQGIKSLPLVYINRWA